MVSGRITNRYQLTYPYSASATQVSVLTPPQGRFLFQYREPVWLNQDVSRTLTAAR